MVAALFSTQFFDKSLDPTFVAFAFSGLFFVLTILGTLTTLQLARLRAAWHDFYAGHEPAQGLLAS